MAIYANFAVESEIVLPDLTAHACLCQPATVKCVHDAPDSVIVCRKSTTRRFLNARTGCVAHRLPTAINSQYSSIQQLEAHGQLTKLQLESLVLQRQGITRMLF